MRIHTILRVRLAWLIGLVAVSVAVVAGCSGDDEEGSVDGSSTPGLVLITSREDSCEYEGPSSVEVGRLTVEAVREGNSDVSIELLRLGPGVEVDDFAAHLEDEQIRLERGSATLGYAQFATLEATLPLEGPSAVQRILKTQPGDLEPGTHVFLCIRSPALELLGPLELTR